MVLAGAVAGSVTAAAAALGAAGTLNGNLASSIMGITNPYKSP